MRPLRSVLYLPASNARAMEKARTLACDGLILDLEDAVAPDAKPAARAAAIEAVTAGGFGRRFVAIRVNPLDTQWGEEDFAAASSVRVDAIVVPKVDSGPEARAAVTAAAGKPVWAMVESARAIINVNDIAGTEGVTALLAGTADLAKDLRAKPDPDRLPFLFAMSAMLYAARANGLIALDGIHAEILDLAGAERTSRQGAKLGFDGRTIVHPSHIAPANDAYSPSPNEVDDARGLIEAHQLTVEQGSGVTTYKGRLVEVLHVEQARQLLSVMDAIASLEKRVL